MISRKWWTALWLAILTLAGVALAATKSASSHARQFEFSYEVRIPQLPPEAKSLRMWVPLPRSDAYQSIHGLTVSSPVAYNRGRDAEYGNEYLYLEVPASARSGGPIELKVRFRVDRREHLVPLDSPPARASGGETREAVPLSRYLSPDHLVPTDGIIAQLSRQQTQGLKTPLEKARAIYNYVVTTVRYDKSGEGWGHGDAIWACTAKRGNCTDFHSLFIAMMRVAGIPARFEIGFPLPPDQREGNIPGYHCWAEFYLEPYGWIPVDASEAWKHPEKRDYFFGGHDADRVLFTMGRDIRLQPAQQGDPLNYFVYPYAEVDGAQFTKLEQKFSFRDLID